MNLKTRPWLNFKRSPWTPTGLFSVYVFSFWCWHCFGRPLQMLCVQPCSSCSNMCCYAQASFQVWRSALHSFSGFSFQPDKCHWASLQGEEMHQCGSVKWYWRSFKLTRISVSVWKICSSRSSSALSVNALLSHFNIKRENKIKTMNAAGRQVEIQV